MNDFLFSASHVMEEPLYQDLSCALCCQPSWKSCCGAAQSPALLFWRVLEDELSQGFSAAWAVPHQMQLTDPFWLKIKTIF